MLAAFRWNLRVLSYIALAVGAFLIYNTISVSVVRRRVRNRHPARTGSHARAVFAAFLGEAVCFGLPARLVGIALGTLDGGRRGAMVAATVESLYVSSRPGPIALDLANRVARVRHRRRRCRSLSAFSPAWEASRVAPVEAMARGRREYEVRLHRFRNLLDRRRRSRLGAWIARAKRPIGGKPLFGYLVRRPADRGVALMSIPALVSALSSSTAMAVVLRRIFGVEALLATRSLAGSLRRTSVSGRRAGHRHRHARRRRHHGRQLPRNRLVWMEDRLQADLYLRPAVPAGADRHPTIAAPNRGPAWRSCPKSPPSIVFAPMRSATTDCPPRSAAATRASPAAIGDRPFFSGESPRGCLSRTGRARHPSIVSEPFRQQASRPSPATRDPYRSRRTARFRSA